MDELSTNNELVGKIKTIIYENKVSILINVLTTLILVASYHFTVVTGIAIADANNKEEPTELKEYKNIIVEVAGAVTNPGLYEVGEDTRVGEAIKLAGDVTEDADTLYLQTSINQSQKIKDAEKLYIPFLWDNKPAAKLNTLVKEVVPVSSNTDVESEENPDSESSENSLVNVNEDTKEALDTLPGIGPAYAQKIIDNRPYWDFAEFAEKSGLSESASGKLKELISF